MIKRAEIIRACTQTVSQMKARRTLRESQTLRNVPNRSKIEKVRMLRPGHSVLAYREADGWRQYDLSRVNENEVDVLLPNGRVSPFPINVVRPLYKRGFKDDNTEIEQKADEGKKKEKEDEKKKDKEKIFGIGKHHMQTRSRVQTRSKALSLITFNNSVEKDLFRESRMQEV